MSMSLDGFVTAAGISPEEPLGVGGERLHEWGTDPVSGVDVGRQLLQAGHVDEVWIHIVPVLFGDGTRLYEQVCGRHLELDFVEAIPTPKATHLHYRLHKS